MLVIPRKLQPETPYVEGCHIYCFFWKPAAYAEGASSQLRKIIVSVLFLLYFYSNIAVSRKN